MLEQCKSINCINIKNIKFLFTQRKVQYKDNYAFVHLNERLMQTLIAYFLIIECSEIWWKGLGCCSDIDVELNFLFTV